jgi:fermentation-respiration switch protein FrsA (DUF1100 family)
MTILESFQNSLLFLPDKNKYGSPEGCGFPYEEVYMNTSDDEKLNGYFFSSPSDKVILYLHGNAQNISAWYEAGVEIRKKIDVNVLIADYRGYGKSTGKPSLEGVVEDALAMYDYLIQRGFKEENISLYGRSLGGGIALELANRKKVKSVTLVSAFTSLLDMAREHYPLIPANVIRNDFLNSRELIKKLTCPIFIVQGDKDSIVMPSHAFNLYEAAPEPKKILILKGAGHNDLLPFYNDEYYETLRELVL